MGRSERLIKPQGPAHGIVIGIDYDLGYQRDEDILADWQGYLPDKELRLLAHAGGLRGPTGAHYYATLPEIMISWETAFRFFREKTLPRWILHEFRLSHHRHPRRMDTLRGLTLTCSATEC